jgi:hypothetical protein
MNDLYTALKELSDYIKFNKSSVLNGMTQREQVEISNLLHDANKALSQHKRK